MGDPVAERRALLERITEPGRLQRAEKLTGRVRLQIATPELCVAAVTTYNVVLDIGNRRVLHGCRDFLGEARQGRICKHVAALLLHLDAEAVRAALDGLTDEAGDWRLEVIPTRDRRT